ncbi:DUF1471 domain-containing protein [Photobacterium sanguinicancri]|uniref:DUF1471 domain-containing protein n=1 Tax=Photobacterium sanguinicancri TaxID=875932 RepID=UPI00078847C9|nr:DUF1471 domain-containing protein [Photobacterium sanguinicancri]KXI20964.1 hypothetical protein AS132_23850 [Photobacterium sanguinicancri]
MKNLIVIGLVAAVLTGCVSRKVPIQPEAAKITPISEIGINQLSCKIVGTHTIGDAHPNNVDRILKNETYMAGGNRYRIITVLETRKSRPSSVVAEFYTCGSDFNSKPAGNVKLLPGAHTVRPISFTEIENNSCKVLSSHVVEKTSPNSLETELANEAFMLGGNRFHITKIIDSDGKNPTSVAADIYRCKHKTVDF